MTTSQLPTPAAVAAMSDQLLALYDAATPEQYERGLAWYDRAAERVEILATTFGVSRVRVACILAITSTRTSLVENFRRTDRALRGQPVRGFLWMDDAVRAPIAGISGPKVTAFAKAILGDRDALVLDTWALRACGVGAKPTAAERRACDAAYRKAAARRCISVRDFQAIVWIVLRESHVERVGHPMTPGGTNVRRRDIHEVAA